MCLKSSPRLPDVRCHCAIHSCFLATDPSSALYNYVSIISLSFKQFFGVIGRGNAKPHLIYSVKAPNPLKAITQYTEIQSTGICICVSESSCRTIVSNLKGTTKQPNRIEASNMCVLFYSKVAWQVTPCKLLLHIPEFNH